MIKKLFTRPERPSFTLKFVRETEEQEPIFLIRFRAIRPITFIVIVVMTILFIVDGFMKNNGSSLF